MKVAFPVKENNGLESIIDEHFGVEHLCFKWVATTTSLYCKFFSILRPFKYLLLYWGFYHKFTQTTRNLFESSILNIQSSQLLISFYQLHKKISLSR